MEEEVPSPCKRSRSRCTRPFGEFNDGESPERLNSAQPTTPCQEESKNFGFKSEKNEPRMIVLALYAPPQTKNNINPRRENTKIKNIGRVSRRKEETQRLLFGRTAAAATTAVSVCKITDLSCCSCNLRGLKLSGCAVVSKGIVVVEGGINSIRSYLKNMVRREDKKSECVKIVWEGKVEKPSFGKFSILHCSSEVAACKFFADHGASHYWDLAVKPT